MRGVFIAFEGIDGSGKSTQVGLLAEHLRARGIEPLLVREPGGTEVGERIRDLLLAPSDDPMVPGCEALLYAASRAELVAKVLKPALEEGRVVVADRFVGSSLAYQGAGRELGVERVGAANELALDGLAPDITVLVRVDAQTSSERLAASGAPADRIEAAGGSFFERVVDAYDQLAEADPVRFVVVDGAAGTADEVFAHVRLAIEAVLAERGLLEGATR
jgi:dTMP kinase